MLYFDLYKRKTIGFSMSTITGPTGRIRLWHLPFFRSGNHTLKYKNPTLVLKKKDLSDEAGKYQRK